MNVYEIKSMAERLSGNTYPGRGIVLGVTPDGKTAVAAYFIMGRSVNSRNRVFVQEPERVSIPGDIDDFTRELWENLNPDNKISLFVRYTNLETRKYQQRILNKHAN